MRHISTMAALAAAAIVLPSPATAQEAGAQLEHVEVSVQTTEGLNLAAYVSRPADATGPLPALFLTQWVSCGSVRPDPDRESTAESLALAAGYALIRVERAGEGESEGPGCDKLDYETEVRHYREALDQLSEHAWINGDALVVYGSSLGSTTAPLVALNKDVAGVIVQGAGALTYLERMIHFDRIQLERAPDFDPLAVDEEMRRRIEFHQYYLHGKMTPDQIAEDHPHLAGVWESLRGTNNAPHYGRPYAWHWQAAEQNWLAAWAGIEAPIMVVFGEYEQFESRHGHKSIVDVVNRLRPGTASWHELSGTGHSLQRYSDIYSAYSFADGESNRQEFIAAVAEWLRELTAERSGQE